MSYRKEIMTAVGTLSCAVGIGFLMQSTEAAHQLYGTKDPSGETQTVIKAAQAGTAMLNVEAITLTAAEFDTVDAEATKMPAPITEVIPASAPAALEPVEDAGKADVAPVCELVSAARPIAAAMVNLTLNAPCLPNERITVHHGGMIFTHITDDTGAIDLKVPALERDATFIMAFTNGEGSVAQTEVVDLADFDRVVLQWKGNTGFEIHAREFGADYGDAGHVWSGKMRDLGFAAAGQGGFITRHGDVGALEPLIAEVYTYPMTGTQHFGVVDLSVEAEVSSANCASEIEAQALQIHGENAVTTRELTLSVPDCDAVGSFLVLNNLFEDLKVASN